MELADYVEVYENERYAPIGGWSAGSLLPTDRNAYSTKDGTAGWNSLSEAELACLSPGWQWAPDSSWVPHSLGSCDAEGWEYCTNFGNIDEGSSGTKGMAHFVRRRRLVKKRQFEVQSLCRTTSKWTCDHCDSEKTEFLSEFLLKILVAASIARHPRQLSLIKLNILKTELIAKLQFDKPGVGIDNCEVLLSSFSEQGRTAWSMVSGALATGDVTENAVRRTAEVTANFTHAERILLAKGIIRHHDVTFAHHCNAHHCGNSCDWKLEGCPNEDCRVILSRRWLPKHDDICPQKIIPCERECGECMYRRLVPIHMNSSCPLKPVECPFATLGCICDLVQATLPTHLDNCIGSHLLLALGKIKEQQETITVLQEGMKTLEHDHNNQLVAFAALQTTVAAAEAAVGVSEKRQMTSLQTEVSRLNSRIGSEVNNLNSQTASNIRVLQEKVAEVARDVATMKKRP